MARDPALGAHFTPEQIARHGAYRGPAYLSLGLSITLQVAVLVILMRGPSRLIERLDDVPGGFVVAAALGGAAVIAALTLAGLPLSFVRGYSIERPGTCRPRALGVGPGTSSARC